MTILFWILLCYGITLITYQSVLIVLFIFLKEDKKADEYHGPYPMVSILIAARNEEDNIISCLKAMEKLSWPIDRYEVLIGDDQSEDKTGEFVNAFIKNKNHFRLFQIQEKLGSAQGKANVLAHLAREAKGAFYFITDADIEVPPYWIQSLLVNHHEKMGIVSGVTKTTGPSLFHHCQKIDWTYAFGMIKVVSDFHIPVSAVGNNMMISAEAYKSTGGYETIPFSVTEDQQLFLETLKKGWQYKNLMSYDCLATTKPITSLSKLLAQRKRWMKGAMKIPMVLLLFLFLQAIFVPFLLVSLYYFPWMGISIWALKIFLQQLFIVLSFRKIKEKYSVIKGIFLYECYAGILSPLVVVTHLIPTKVRWKGRIY